MDPPPTPGTYAARAAYFADKVCSFCGHHNPVGSCFCNECGSPLGLKPCDRCDAVNHLAAVTCYRCGAAFATTGTTPVLLTAEDSGMWASWGLGVAQSATPLPLVGAPVRAGLDLLKANRILLAAVAAILIAGAYAAYRIPATEPDALAIASPPSDAGEHHVAMAAPPVPAAPQPKGLEPETTKVLDAPMPAINAETPKRPSARPRPVQAPARATPPVAQRRAAAPVREAAAQTHKARPPDPRQTMQVALASCGGDLIDRIACDQRVRRHYCQGQWGRTPECSSGVAKDHGQ
jgi:hypothetical protein